MSPMTKIDIFQFTEVASFLKAVLSERRTKKSTNSLRQLARRAGFQSPATLSMLIHQKRQLTPSTAEKLAVALGLTGRRRRYLLTMARVASAKSSLDRARHTQELVELRASVDETEIDAKHYKFLSQWYYTCLYVLAGNKDFNDDPQYLSRRLKGLVTPQDVSIALKELCELGVLQKTGSGYRQIAPAITTKDDVRSTAIYLYHKRMNRLADQALDLPISDREFNGITVCIPANRIDEVKQKVREFRRELNEFLSQFDEPSEVFQINFQIFPLTEASQNERNPEARSSDIDEEKDEHL